MSRIKIIGIGSPFGNDDFGWRVIRKLEEEYKLPHVKFIVSDRPGTTLLEHLKGSDIAILVDAIDDVSHAGEIRQLSAAELASLHRPVSSHAFGVSETLALGQALNMLPQTITLFGLCLDSNGITGASEKALSQICKHIDMYIRQLPAQIYTERCQ